MSDYVPFEILEQIIVSLPVKSVIRCRSVSKALKYLIDSSEFIARYSVRHSQPQRLLVSYIDSVDCEEKYVSFVDDDTFPRQKFAPTVPWIVQALDNSKIVNSCQGVFCLYGIYVEPYSCHLAVLWNPSIRKSVVITLPKNLHELHEVGLGFGVCPGTSDPKIIHICKQYEKYKDNIHCAPWQVEVFTLSSGAWRSPSSHLPRKSINFTMSQAVIGRFLYWSADDIIPIDGGFQHCNLIMSFDLINDEFGEVYLSDSLGLKYYKILSIFNLRESLAVIVTSRFVGMEVYHVWMTDHADAGVPKSFRKMFTIESPYPSSINNVMGFRKTGQPIVQTDYLVENDYVPEGLAVYDPYLEDVEHIGIYL